MGRSREWTATGELSSRDRDTQRRNGHRVQNQREADRDGQKQRLANTGMRKWMEGERATEGLSEGDRDTGTQTFRKLDSPRSRLERLRAEMGVGARLGNGERPQR